MANSDNREDSADKAQQKGTSSNREESMESGSDVFSDKSPARNPGSKSQGDGTEDFADNTYIGKAGRQSPTDPGTTPLGGESSDDDATIGPGGVEGDSGTR